MFYTLSLNAVKRVPTVYCPLAQNRRVASPAISWQYPSQPRKSLLCESNIIIIIIDGPGTPGFFVLFFFRFRFAYYFARDPRINGVANRCCMTCLSGFTGAKLYRAIPFYTFIIITKNGCSFRFDRCRSACRRREDGWEGARRGWILRRLEDEIIE